MPFVLNNILEIPIRNWNLDETIQETKQTNNIRDTYKELKPNWEHGNMKVHSIILEIPIRNWNAKTTFEIKKV